MREETSLAKYVCVYLALAALALLSWAAAYWPHGSATLHTAIALSIAFLKMLLIGAFFMHLKGGRELNRIFAGAGLIWLAMLFILAFTDYRSREWMTMPSPWPVISDKK